MARAQHVSVEPFIQGNIGDVGADVEAASVERQILVLARTVQMDLFSVEENIMAAHFDAAAAELLLIQIAAESDARRIQMWRAGICLPKLRLVNAQRSFAARGPGNDSSLRIEDLETDVAFACGFDGIGDVAEHVAEDSYAVNVILRRGIQADGAGDAGIVEEIEIGQVHAFFLLQALASLHGRNTLVV